MDGLIELQEGSGNSNGNTDSLQQYITANQDKVIDDWSYVANTSSVGKFGSYTLSLVQAFKSESITKELKNTLGVRILKAELKGIYRAFNTYKPVQTLPALALLEQIAIYCGNEVYNNFDFTFKTIPRLVSNPPYRSAFLKFYMECIRHSSAPVRRELLSNRKIFSAWVGKMSLEDGDELICQSLDVLKSCVLKDTAVFTKSAKMGLFNDWTLKNMVKILSVNPSEAVVLQISSFLIQLLCDKTYGVHIPHGDDRLALSFLKIVKPWENVAQMDLVIRLLKELPNIQVQYFDNLAISYPLTPKVSMWWFSYSVLHARFAKLDVEYDSLKNDFKLDTQIISKLILPSTVTKQALLQSLQFKESNLIRFQAAEIILFSLRKLQTLIKEFYEPMQLDPSVLIDEIFNRLPEVQIFSKQCQPELLQASYLAILNTMCHIRPLNVVLPMPLVAKSVTGVQLILQQNILEIQTFTGEQTKWWNPTKNEPSLFTQLLISASYNPKLTDTCIRLLDHLAAPTQMFAELETLATFGSSLIYTLFAAKFKTKLVYELLDQAAMRAVNQPYQYIDKLPAAVGKVSPFIIALFDQYQHFKSKDTDSEVLNWLVSFSNCLKVLGEDHNDLVTLYGIQDEPKYNLDECFDFVLGANEKSVMNRHDLVLKISNNLEVCAVLYRAANTSNKKLRDFLLANIPADKLPLLLKPAAFELFMNAENLRPYLSLLSDVHIEESSAFVTALQSSDLWELGISFETTKFLVHKLVETKNGEVLKELNKREFILPSEIVVNLLDVDEIADNMNMMETGSLEFDPAWFQKCSTVDVVCAAIKASGEVPDDMIDAKVLAAVSLYKPEKLPSSTLEVARKSIDAGKSDGIIIASSFTHLTDEVWNSLVQYISSGKSNKNHSVLLPELIKLSKLSSESSEVAQSMRPLWLKVVVQQLTKHYLNQKVSDDVINFISLFNSEVLNSDAPSIFNDVNSNSVRALMEAAINYDDNPKTYELVARLSLQFRQSKNFSGEYSSQLLTTLLEKPLQSSISESLLILALFEPRFSSTRAIQNGVLSRYSGSLSCVDSILFYVLELIESNRQRSWVDDVESWDIRPTAKTLNAVSNEYEQDPLFLLKDNKIYVTLDELRIKDTVSQFEPIPDFSLESTRYDDWITITQKYISNSPENCSSLYNNTFLLNAIISCEQLETNLDSLLQSGLLSFVFCCAADPKLADTACAYLAHVFEILTSKPPFKDSSAVRMLIGKLLMVRETQEVPTFIPLLMANMTLVIAKPNHFLYDKVSSWLLASPQIKTHEVPLIKMIQDSQSDLKTRELLWIFSALRSSIINSATVEFYEQQGILDWCLSHFKLIDTKYKPLREAVHGLINKITEIHGGSSALINGAGVLAVQEMEPRVAYSSGSKCLSRWTEIDTTRLLQNSVSN